MHVSSPVHQLRFALFLVPLAWLLIVGSAISCRRDNLPDPSSKEYRDAVSAFYTGLVALEVGDDSRADCYLTWTTQLVPDEPAGWANRGLLLLRQKEFDKAFEDLERARGLAPDSDQINVLLGLVESNRGRFSEAITLLRQAIAANPQNLRARYAVASEIERAGGENSDRAAQTLIEEILQRQPDNLAMQLEIVRLAAKRGDAETLRANLASLATNPAVQASDVREQFAALQTAANSENPRSAAARVAFLRNVLVRSVQYRQSLAAVRTPPEQIGEPIANFLRLPVPDHRPAAPDEALAFTAEPLLDEEAGEWQWASALTLTGEAAPIVVVANGREVRVGSQNTIAFPGGPSATPPGADGVLGADFNYDFRIDLVLAGAGGVRFFQQTEAARFTDATARTTLPGPVLSRSYTGAWAADVEADGDLDVLLGAAEGPPAVLRNNGDGTWRELPLFAEVRALRGFAWADIDADGDTDAALVDASGTLRVFTNERAGQFRARPTPPEVKQVAAVAAADVNSDGTLDLLTLHTDGRVNLLADKDEGSGWTTTEVAQVKEASGSNSVGTVGGTWRLCVVDADNNGGLDLVLSTGASTGVWLSDQEGKFQSLPRAAVPPASVFSIADLTSDGKLDLIGLSDAKQPVRLVNRGSKNYGWQDFRQRAQKTTGDQRINSFGIGGEMEIRAGLLVQKQVITGPTVHFGLGEQPSADLVRIVWPNGSLQAEFAFQPNQKILAEQRLKGSCPWVFAYDGSGMKFVTDFIWRSPLGLRINAQDTADVTQTEDWVKIAGTQLVPRRDDKRDFYDIRITAELWETHFFDHVSLMVVDHPKETEVFVDERFSFPPTKLAVEAMSRLQPVAGAWDDRGRDVADTVSERDERYLDFAGRGAYQGVTRDHYVEIELPDNAPLNELLWLVASGWIHPTDSSINVAIGQGTHAPPQSLSLEVADGRGGWRVANPRLGFPAGKAKTILINLDGIFEPHAPRRLRLRTNMEIFWDRLAWAQRLPQTELRTSRFAPDTADLAYRGFSIVRQANESSPELPEYEKMAGTTQRWRDLIGYHTRFGDVRELLEQVDDRYVIMNAGDEMRFRFPAPTAPPDGWTRDFVLIGDGWVKDGDYNTTFSKTVLPLPSHKQLRYSTPPGRLEDDPVYQRHRQDWSDYHTRYVTPDAFTRALRRPSR